MFIAIDGNSTGKIIERMIFESRLEELAEFSSKIQHKIQLFGETITSHEGHIIMAGGDNILAEIPSQAYYSVLANLGSLSDGNYTYSVAVSETAQGAYMGLKYAKATGKRIVKAGIGDGAKLGFIAISD